MSRIKGPLSGNTKRRLYGLFIMFLTGYIFLFYRLTDIQILKSKEYKKRVDDQSLEKIELNSGRGIIYDRNYKPLTDSQKVKIIVVSKERLSEDNNLLDMIKNATNLSEIDIYKLFHQQKGSDMLQIEVEKISNNMEDKLEANNIIVEDKVIRYSKDGILSHTIGHLKKSDNSGVLGIEKSMEDILSKSHEKYISAFKAGDSGNKNNLNILKGSIKTIDGSEDDRHIKITIDYDIQKKVESIINKEENPTGVIISHIESGEILSIGSRPNFDQNNIAKYLNSTTNNGECINRVTNATYPPASVFKLVVLYAALENNLIDEDYSYNCTGSVSIEDGKVASCHKKEGHGIQNIEQALSNSCNTTFFDIAKKVGKKKILKAAKSLHLIEEIGIGIEEKNGQIPNNIDLWNLAVGQGEIQISPLQINQMTQIIANNGTYKPLYLYDSVIDNNKNIVKIFKTSKEEEVISPYSITKIKEMMKSVSKVGTAKTLSDLEGGSGVKTGTAQTIKDITHGWITGYYPENNPKYAITVIVEGTKESNKSATPIFKEICQSLNKNIIK